MTAPVDRSAPDAARPAGADPEAYDIPDQVAAQRVWLALLRGETGAGHRLTDRQWRCVADEATRHHLRGVTYRRLADSTITTGIPDDVWERLRSFYLETATRNAVYFRQTSQIVKELAAWDVPVMLLKGIHLARFAYAEPGLRSMADIDIMVHREHLAVAEQVLLGRGYGPVPRPDIEEWCATNHHLDKLRKQGAPEMEVHWSIQRPANPFRLDLAGLWQRSESAMLDGAPVRLLSPEDLLLHLSLHLTYQHRFTRAALKGVMDIATVITAERNRIDWTTLAERATAWGASGCLYTTLRLATEILAAPVPPDLFRALPHQQADEEIVEPARRYILMLRAVLPTAYMRLARGGTLRDRAKLLLGAVFLPRERMEAVYALRPGTPLVYPYYVVRLASLLRTRGSLLLHTLLRTRHIQRTLDRERDRLALDRWTSAPLR